MVVVIFDVQGEGEVDENVGENCFKWSSLSKRLFLFLACPRVHQQTFDSPQKCIQNKSDYEEEGVPQRHQNFFFLEKTETSNLYPKQ